MRVLWIVVVAALALSACSSSSPTTKTRWDRYYARTDGPRAHVQVVPPEGTTLPMAQLIAEYVAEKLEKENVSAAVGSARASKGRHFVLTGYAQDKRDDPRVSYHHVLQWMLSDSRGRLISTYTHGVEGSEQQWDFGDPEVLAAIGIGTAGPVSQMVLKETKAKVPIDPKRRGLLIEQVTGLAPQDAAPLTQAMAEALRSSDLWVTGDPRQASFRLAGHVEILPAEDGFDDVKIVWRVLTLDHKELGNAVQDNRVPSGSLNGRWEAVSPSIAKAAAVGVEHLFGTRIGPAPGSTSYPEGEPPSIVLPGQPGRAMPPPQ